MNLKERNYQALIISNMPKMSESLQQMLMSVHRFEVTKTISASMARRYISEKQFDMVFILPPLQDENGVQLSIDLSSNQGSVITMIIGSDHYDVIFSHVYPYGVYVLPRPLNRQLAALALDWMQTTRERMRGLESRTNTLEGKMAEIRLVNRAKWLLVSKKNMSEEDAHRFIEKSAMDNCVTKGKIAQGILDKYLNT